MIDTLLDPAVLCFAAGLLAGLVRSDLRVPEALYESLSVYLLLAIGLKGGVALHGSSLASLTAPLLGTLALGLVVPLVAFVILRALLRFERADSAALAAHYGSVSAVTFAVVLGFLDRAGQSYEEIVTGLLVVLEIPAIAVGVLLARRGFRAARLAPVAREVLLGKSIYLLLAGLAIGIACGPDRFARAAPLFVGLFPGALALFLLEMGLIASRRLHELRRSGVRLVAFALGMPLLSAALALPVALLCGLSIGGTTVLATLAASASYIAAPAAMRIAVPEANPSLYLTASLGVTFPFNLIAGIPLYYRLSLWAHGA